MKRKIVILLFILLLSLCLFATVSCDTEGGTNGEGKYTVSFVVDNNIYSTVNNFSSTSEIPSIPTKEGYEFIGWYYDNGSWKKPFSQTDIITEDTTVFCKWQLIEYKAVFVADEKEIYSEYFTILDETLNNEPNVPTKNGYTGEWQEYSLNKEDVRIKAIYTPITYTIDYENTKNASNPNFTEYTIESETMSLATLRGVDGYEFDGWYVGNKKVEEIATGSVGNKTLTAKWKPIVYNITYTGTEGAYNSNTTSYTIESNTIYLRDLSLDGYVFAGWYCENNNITQIDAGSFGDIVIEARWKLYNEIYTVEDLMSISMNGRYILANDLDLNGIEWTPLGSKNSPFTGAFNGGGYTISNFTITTKQRYIGLFGYNQGLIEDLNIDNYTINVSVDSAYGTITSGSIVAYNEGTISNCSSNGTVNVSSDGYYSDYKFYVYAGGIVGHNCGGSVNRCSSRGEIIGKISSSGAYSYCYVGGTVGKNETGSVSNCTTECTVKSSSVSTNKTDPPNEYLDITYCAYAGGIVGYNDGNIDGCTSKTDANSYVQGYNCTLRYRPVYYAYAGGIVGYTKGAVSNCDSSGAISTSDSVKGLSSYAYTGGIAGYNKSTICKCSSVSDITVSYGTCIYSYVGGIVGYNYEGAVENCYNIGNITISPKGSYSSSNTYNGAVAGGVVGYNYSGSTLLNSYSVGDLSVTSYSSATVGGVVGSNGGTTENCYSVSSITISARYSAYAGKIAGSSSEDNVKNCYYSAGETVSLTGSTTNETVLVVEKDSNDIKTDTFHFDILGWSKDNWIITEDNYPTLTKTKDSE